MTTAQRPDVLIARPVSRVPKEGLGLAFDGRISASVGRTFLLVCLRHLCPGSTLLDRS